MTSTTDPLAGLRRLRATATTGTIPTNGSGQVSPAREVCEMCGVDIDADHGHVADVQAQRLLCVCRACRLLFARPEAGTGRFRALPQEHRSVVDVAISPQQWEAVQVPVDLAFFFRRGATDGFAACYPGPGGATESLLDLTAWAEVLRANPVLDHVQPDVEAVLLRRRAEGFSCYLVPIDTCYELVGLVRSLWVGLSGGAEVWSGVGSFFDNLDRRSTAVDRTGESVGHG